MRNTKQIIGFPIISINDGNKVGTVKSLVVNAELRTIDRGILRKIQEDSPSVMVDLAMNV